MKKAVSVLTCFSLIFLPYLAFAADRTFFYHTDPAGTPLAMTDSSGAVVWKADYKPFGEENSTTGAASNDRRFVGKEKDEETGLSYFGARYEDAKTGRFIAPDPVRAIDAKTSKTNEKLLLNPQRLNTYVYGLNNPYRYIDPDGHHPIMIAAGIILLGEMVMPQTMGSSGSDSFIGRHWSDLLILPLGIQREGAIAASKATTQLAERNRVAELADKTSKWLGEGSRTIKNEAGDYVFVSKDGTKRIRFDINRPYPHQNPHGHVEEFISGKWQKSGPIYPKNIPRE